LSFAGGSKESARFCPRSSIFKHLGAKTCHWLKLSRAAPESAPNLIPKRLLAGAKRLSQARLGADGAGGDPALWARTLGYRLYTRL
jgi:hypothetical protein